MVTEKVDVGALLSLNRSVYDVKYSYTEYSALSNPTIRSVKITLILLIKVNSKILKKLSKLAKSPLHESISEFEMYIVYSYNSEIYIINLK